jgi:long-chain fatty acid transport protein
LKKHARKFLFGALALASLAQYAFATDGYFVTGIGTKQQGKGGVGVAVPGDSLTIATNPAGLLFVGNRYDGGVTVFRPNRDGTITGNVLPPPYPDVNGTYDANRVQNFVLPELGYSHLYRPNISYGVAIYGNGGLNTSYTQPIPLLGTTRGGVDLDQVFISPAVGFKLGNRNTIGIAANILDQRVSVEGLQNFANSTYSSDPLHVTNTGYSYSYGGGFRIGWIGQVNNALNLGVTYQSKTYASAFARYKGLFAEGGKFDVPANFAVGASYKLGPNATVSADLERIQYSGVKSIANSDANQALLGSANGPGFGWHSVSVIKTGFDYAVTPALTARAGYNHSGAPFDFTQNFFNLLAPAVTQDHLHVGATWTTKGEKEISFAYVHAFSNTLNGALNSIPASAGGGSANLTMYQNSFQIGFGWKR